MIEKKLAKIIGVKTGFCGYQDAQFGFELRFGGDDWSHGAWMRGHWGMEPSVGAKWTVEDQTKAWGEAMRAILEIMKQAKVKEVGQLLGKPVELTIEDGGFKDFRILTEVL